MLPSESHNVYYPGKQLPIWVTSRFLALVIGLFTSVAVYAQSGISGYCYSKNGNPLTNVEITATQFDDHQVTITNESGFYDKELATGEWILMYSYKGEQVKKEITIRDKTIKLKLNITFQDK